MSRVTPLPKGRHLLCPLVALLCGLLTLAGCRREPEYDEKNPGKLIITKSALSPRWSKNSASIYDGVGRSLRRYDVASGKVTRYQIPVHFDKFDISPDERSIVCSHQYDSRIVTVDLATKAVNTIYAFTPRPEGTGDLLKNSIRKVLWLADGRILFTQQRDDFCQDVFLVNADGTDLNPIPGVVLRGKDEGRIFCASDGTGFVYVAKDLYRHHYTLTTGKDVSLSFLGDLNNVDVNIKYLSRRYMIYHTREYRHFTDHVEILNLVSMERLSYTLPIVLQMQEISPDMSKYWYILMPSPHSPLPSMLYLADVPPETLERLPDHAP